MTPVPGSDSPSAWHDEPLVSLRAGNLPVALRVVQIERIVELGDVWPLPLLRPGVCGVFLHEHNFVPLLLLGEMPLAAAPWAAVVQARQHQVALAVAGSGRLHGRFRPLAAPPPVPAALPPATTQAVRVEAHAAPLWLVDTDALVADW